MTFHLLAAESAEASLSDTHAASTLAIAAQAQQMLDDAANVDSAPVKSESMEGKAPVESPCFCAAAALP